MKKQQNEKPQLDKKQNLMCNILIQALFVNTFRTYIYEMFREIPFELQVKNAIREMFFILIQRKKEKYTLDDPFQSIFPPNDIRYKFKVEILEIEINTEKNLDTPNNNWFNISNCKNILELSIRYRIDIKSNIINKSFELVNLYSTIITENYKRNGRKCSPIEFTNNYAVINYDNNRNNDLRDLRRSKTKFNNQSNMKYYRYLDQLSTNCGLVKYYNASHHVSIYSPYTGIMNILNSINEFNISNVKNNKYANDLINSAFVKYFECVKGGIQLQIKQNFTNKNERFVLPRIIFEQFGYDFDFSNFYENQEGPYLSYNNYY